MILGGKISKKSIKAFTAVVCAGVVLSWGGQGYAAGADDGTFKNFSEEMQRELYQKADEERADQEFKNSTGLETINADKAYALRYSGAGVTLGIIDKGVSSSHREFRDKVINTNMSEHDMDTYNWRLNVSGNDQTHGSSVAAIMAANKNSEINSEFNVQGVSYDSAIQSQNINYVWDADFTDNVKIINASIGISDRDSAQNIIDMVIVPNIVNKSKIYVTTSGNEGELQSGYIPKFLNDDDIAKYSFINATSINKNNNLSSFSNIANGAEKNTVSAPGNQIYTVSLSRDDEYEKRDGTSFSAPYISGTLGLVNEAYPWLNGKQLTDVILSTVDNKFNCPDMIVLCNTDNENHLIGANVIYINHDIPKDLDTIKNDMINWYKNNPDNKFSSKYSSAEKFAQNIKIVNTVSLSKEQVYGQGIVDAGKAVQGIGAIDIGRLSDSDISTDYSNDVKGSYLYSVNTGKQSDNYQYRFYSIWSNDIGVKNPNVYYNAGLSKTGKVDLILLGENTYNGPTVVNEGNLQIVRGVEGDVYAFGDKTSAEINGKSKTVYAFDNSTINIKDNIAYREDDANKENNDWYNKALPHTTKVDVAGGLFAVDSSNGGSTINVDLNEKESRVFGGVYQGDKSEINVSLSNGAQLSIAPINGYYKGNEYKSNNTLNKLTLNSNGELDMSLPVSYTKFTIGTLGGNGGIFTIKTDLRNETGDFLQINNSTGAQEHKIRFWDKFADKDFENITKEGHSLYVANSPDNVIFHPEATNLLSGQFNPLIDYIPNNGRNEWYLYGFNNISRLPINGIVNRTGIYTTDDILNDGIKAPNAIIKVIKGNAPRMKVNKIDSKDNLVAVDDSLKIIGDGDVEINATNESATGYTIGIGRNLGDNSEDYKFSATQNIDINVEGNNNLYGIFTPEGTSSNNTAEFGKNLNINISEEARSSNKSDEIGISFNGEFKVIGDTQVGLKSYKKSLVGIDNRLKTNVLDFEKNLNIILESDERDSSAFKNNGTINVGENLNIDTINNYKYSVNYEDPLYIVGDNQGELNIGKDFNVLGKMNNRSDSLYRTVILNNGNDGSVKIKGNFNAKISDNTAETGYLINTVINNKGNIAVDNDINIEGVADWKYAINNDKNAKISASQINATGLIDNAGILGIKGDVLADQLNNAGEVEIKKSLKVETLTNENTGSISTNNVIATKSIYNEGVMNIDDEIKADSVSNSGDINATSITINTLSNRTVEGKKITAKNINVNDTIWNNGDIKVTETIKANKIKGDKVASASITAGSIIADNIDIVGSIYADNIDAKSFRAENSITNADLINVDESFVNFGEITANEMKVGELQSEGNMTVNKLNVKGKTHINSGSYSANSVFMADTATFEGDVAIAKDMEVNDFRVNGVFTYSSSDSSAGKIKEININASTSNYLDKYGIYVNGKLEIDKFNLYKGSIGGDSYGNLNVSGNLNVVNENVSDLAISTRDLKMQINPNKNAIVKIIGSIDGGHDKADKRLRFINLSSADSYLVGHVKDSMLSLSLDNGSKWEVGNDDYVKYNPSYTFAPKQDRVEYIGSLELNNNAVVSLYNPTSISGISMYTRDRTANQYTMSGDNKYYKTLRIDTISGTGGIFNLGISQDRNDKSIIYSDTLEIEKNITPNARHTIHLSPTQADFILTNDVKIKPFMVATDASVENGGYFINFVADKFDAGLYNYTPTITSKSPNGMYNEWQITDIKRTGESGGDSGNSGTPGTGGDNGNSGSPGTDGDNGSSGTPGTGGDNGNSGTPGTGGDNGNSGTPGTGGDNGNSGTPGTGDDNGNSGTPGTGGDNGNSGTPGTGGSNGNSGTPGTGGDNGNSGTPGTGGDNGNSGTPGTGGDNGNTGNNGNNNNGNSGNNGSGNGNGNGTGTGSQPVISNLAHNIQGAAVNNFFRFHNEYNNINRRLGNLRMAAEDEGAWVRYMAGKDDSDAYGFSERYSGTQVGYDKSVTMDDGGKWFFGGAVSYYKGSTSYAHQGSSEDRSRGLALYASYLGDKGHYLDIIARHSKLTSEMDSYAAGTGAMVHGEMDTWGTSLGVEYGRKISMNDGFYWQPEAELIYGSIAGTEYTMSDGTHVNQGGINSLTMRTGVTFGRQIKDVSYFVSASYNHDFSTTSSVSMRDKYGATYSTDRNLANSWWTVALGAAANVSKNTYCYIDLEKSFGGDITKKWQVNAGVRFSF